MRAGLDKGLEAEPAVDTVATSTAMGMVITAASGFTRTILLEVIGEDTTIEEGFVTTVVVAPEGCTRIRGLGDTIVVDGLII